MLNKLITNLKNSLSKKKGDEVPEGEEENVEVEATEEKAVASEDDAAKKKKSMIIKVIVVLGLVYLAVDQFVLKNDEANVAEIAPAKPKRKRPKKDVAPTDATAQPNPQAQTAGQPVDPNVVNPANDPNPKNDTTTLPPTENANVTTKTDDQTTATATTTNEVTSSTIIPPKDESTASSAIDKIMDKPKEAEKVPEKVEVKEVEKIVETAPEKPADKVEEKIEQKPMTLGETKQKEKQLDKELDKLIDGAEGIKKEEKPAIDLKDKIAVDDTYVEPPSYENPGRGLVYNCKEKFWVCVDKPTYVQCNKNMKYNKSHSKPAECAVVNVYGTTEDCGLMQKYNVSHNVVTDFCN